MKDKYLKFALQRFADGPEPTPEPEPEPKPDDKKYTDKDVDEIVKKKLARAKAQEEERVKAAKEEAEKLAKMNAEEKRKHEFEKLQKENEELKKAATKLEITKTAAGLLKEREIDATPEMLELVVTDSAETTQGNIEKLVSIIQAQVEAAEKKRATGTPPPAFSGEGEKTVTKAEFARMTYQEVVKLKAENPELYKQLTE